MLIQEPPLQVLPTLAVAIGVNSALFVQQLHYWIRMSAHLYEGRRWIYNTYEGWELQFPFWSRMTIRRLINHLEQPLPGCDRPLVMTTTEFNRYPTDQTKWYTLDYEILENICDQMDTRAVSTEPLMPSLHPDVTSPSLVNTPSVQSEPLEVFNLNHWKCSDRTIGSVQVDHLSLRQRLLTETNKRENQTPCAPVRETQEESETAQTEPSVAALPTPPPRETHPSSSSESDTGETSQAFTDTSDHQDMSLTRPQPLTEATRPDRQPTISAPELIQRFHARVHDRADQPPHPKELEHANRLLTEQGSAFAHYFLAFACQAARQDDFKPEVFGGLLRYEGAAVAAYHAHQARQAKAGAELTQAREALLRQQYEQERSALITAYQATLSPEDLLSLQEAVRVDLFARETIPRCALDLRLKVAVEDRIAQDVGVPSYAAWLQQRKDQRQSVS